MVSQEEARAILNRNKRCKRYTVEETKKVYQFLKLIIENNVPKIINKKNERR